jgi:hypothetical protein
MQQTALRKVAGSLGNQDPILIRVLLLILKSAARLS